ncbi:glycosyltransferase [Xanthomonas arboricola pv. juglandis]|uniref:glycosyltransferase n=2 Tax=Xanthomonas arboricola TaxID=56448 RepID=UPI0002EA7405|nr:glycosyltransferase [Xanthomonas arboricola]MDN0218695.1 glycosyltransferase [Xanthomonas arboricola pv. juglandis]MDN0222944.1 glycosyltransferase [Xanthomonas arboricola pv. juglandis]MDN0227219.1 glycosyltransferase [Xanthomonas arboricola pv. juglandis]MDN0231503.1 glycosyltransferase [Xanthomonas arboricola pv. juglandis]MDN0235720.1 glycosyltransferase [Xanthomonas arboricola pv. juglandis]
MARIMIFGKYPPIQGGVSRSLYWLAQNLARAGHIITVITNAEGVESNFKQLLESDDLLMLKSAGAGYEVNVINVDVLRGKTIPGDVPFLSLLIGAGLREAHSAKPDLIIGWYLEPYVVAGAFVSRELKIRSIALHAGSDLARLSKYPELEATFRCILEWHNFVLTKLGSARSVSDLRRLGVADQKLMYYGGSGLEDIYYSSPNPIEVNDVCTKAVEHLRALDLSARAVSAVIDINKKDFDSIDGVVLGIYGKIGYAKGSFALLEVLSKIAKAGVPFRFLFMPTGSSRLMDRFFKSVTSDPTLAARAWYIPPCAPWKVPRFIDRCDAIFILEKNADVPYHGSRIPREVLARSKCCVMPRNISIGKGIYDVLIDGENVAFIDDVANLDQLRDVVLRILGDKEFVQNISLLARGASDAIEYGLGSQLSLLDVVGRLVNERSVGR